MHYIKVINLQPASGKLSLTYGLETVSMTLFKIIFKKWNEGIFSFSFKHVASCLFNSTEFKNNLVLCTDFLSFAAFEQRQASC